MEEGFDLHPFVVNSLSMLSPTLTAMEDIDLVHTPGHHPLLPVPKELNVRPPRANAHAAGILKQMMVDAPVAEDQVLDIAAGIEKSPKEEMTLLCSSTPCSPAKQITSVPSAPDDIIDSPAGTETIKAVLPSVRLSPLSSLMLACFHAQGFRCLHTGADRGRCAIKWMRLAHPQAREGVHSESGFELRTVLALASAPYPGVE